MTVDELREALEGLPGHHQVFIEVASTDEYGWEHRHQDEPSRLERQDFCVVVIR